MPRASSQPPPISAELLRLRHAEYRLVRENHMLKRRVAALEASLSRATVRRLRRRLQTEQPCGAA